MRRLILIVILTAALLLAACNSSGEEGAASDSAGKELFAKTVLGSKAGCATCHSLEPGIVIIGPSVAGIGTRAGAVVAGQSAEDYLRESIIDPDAYIVEGYPPSTMPKGYDQELTSDQVDQLVAYLLSLQ